MEVQAKTNSFKHLNFMCSDYSRLSTKIGLLSFDNNSRNIPFDIFILFYEYLQLISQILIFNPYIEKSETLGDQALFSGIIYIARRLNPGYWIEFEGEKHYAMIVLIALTCIMLLRYLVFLYIVLVAMFHVRKIDPLITLWKWIFKIQGRILYSLFSCFWVNAILAVSKGEFDHLGIGNTGVVIWSAFMIISEFVFSFFLMARFCYVLPTRSLLAAKDNKVEFIVLIQKLAIQILQISLYSANLKASSWIFTLVNLVLCLARDFQYFTTLPLYNVLALKFQGTLLVITSSLCISSFLHVITRAAGSTDPEVEFIVVVWVILSILAIIISLELLDR